MKKTWLTKEQDMYVAQCILEEYARAQNSASLGLFELVLNQRKKRMGFRLSSWVFTLAHYFKAQYGVNHGDFVTRRVITCCMTQGETVH